MINICACFVLYNPSETHHLTAIENTLAVGAKVVVFDNSDQSDLVRNNRYAIQEKFRGDVDLIGGEGNIGLSSAFNRIVDFVGRKYNLEAVVIFDQDSTVTSETFNRLVLGYREVAEVENVGVYSAFAVRENGVPYRVKADGPPLRSKPGVIRVKFSPSSFSLIPMSSFSAVGQFQDDFFIDHIDVDFCLRCRLSGLAVMMDSDLRFPHRIGEGDVKLAGQSMPLSSPFRHYYQVRNIILSDRRNMQSVFRTARTLLIKSIKVCVLGVANRDLILRLSYCARGFKDGLSGRGGRLS